VEIPAIKGKQMKLSALGLAALAALVVRN